MKTETDTFLAHLKKSIGQDIITYKKYIQLCLYHPEHGYYSKSKKRVGRSKDSDFYTAESLGAVFSDCVLASINNLFNTSDLSGDLSDYTFIEIGTEPEYSLLHSLKEHPFKKTEVLRLGNDLTIEDPHTILFANEWMDALAFHRIIFKQGQWRERGVQFNASGILEEILLDTFSEELEPTSHKLPKIAPENYEMDLCLEAANQVTELLKSPWKGIGLFFDYGRTWDELLYQRPKGTARTYSQHKQGTDLLENPSTSDITCDVCWDFVLEALGNDPNSTAQLHSQESFFIHKAGTVIEKIIAESAFAFSEEKQTLMELIHPSHMGKKFQVLHFIRN